MTESKKPRSPLTLRVTEDLEQMLRDIAEDRGETVSTYIRGVLIASTGADSPMKQETTAV